MTRKMIFFINPVSGTINKRRLEKKIYAECVKRNSAFEILYTAADGNYEFLRNRVTEDDITDVVVCGGDGSLRPIIAAILNTGVNIGIIPSGSGNGLARTAGIPMNTHAALKVVFEGTPIPVDAFLINGNLSCHLSGIGFDARIAHEFAGSKRRGLKTYALKVFHNLSAIQTYPFNLYSNGQSFHEEAICITIANSNQFGNNVKIAPEASLCDQLLDIVVFRKSGMSSALMSLLKQMVRGKVRTLTEERIHKSGVLYFQSGRISIENPALAPLHIDGDPAETAHHIEVEVLPQAYRLLQMK